MISVLERCAYRKIGAAIAIQRYNSLELLVMLDLAKIQKQFLNGLANTYEF